MKFDFNKLTNDLREANRLAKERADSSDDGGSANLDRVFLMIKGARESKVIEAIKNAGLYCRGKSEWIGAGYFINPTTGGQGNKRALGVEVMSKYLQSCGWETLAYCQLD